MMNTRLYSARLVIVALLASICYCAGAVEEVAGAGGGGSGVVPQAEALLVGAINWPEIFVLDFAKLFLKAKPEFVSSSSVMREWNNLRKIANATFPRTPERTDLQALRKEIKNALVDPVVPFSEVIRVYDAYFAQLQASSLCARDKTPWHAIDVSNTAINSLRRALLDNIQEPSKFITYHTQLTSFESTSVLPFVQRKQFANKTKILFIGDLHGSQHSLLRNMLHMAQQGYITNDWQLADDMHLVVLGDMVDYGVYGTEVIYTLLRLKLANWDRVFLLRGNHESESVTQVYGFNTELQKKYPGAIDYYEDSDDEDTEPQYHADILYQKFIAMSATLPLALFISSAASPGSYVQCCHGGIEPFYNPSAFLANPDLVKEYDMVFANGPIDFKPVKQVDDKFITIELAKYYTGEGFQWSDFTGVTEDSPNAYFIGQINKACFLNAGRGTVGFNANQADIDLYFADRPLLKAFIRGHQDTGYCCKLINPGKSSLVAWWRAEVTPEGTHNNCMTGITLYDQEHYRMWRALTMSSAADAKGNITEGYGMLYMAGIFSDWRYYIHENLLASNMYEDRGAKNLGYAYVMKEDSGGVDSQNSIWDKDPEEGGVDKDLADILLGNENPSEDFDCDEPESDSEEGDEEHAAEHEEEVAGGGVGIAPAEMPAEGEIAQARENKRQRVGNDGKEGGGASGSTDSDNDFLSGLGPDAESW
jgi:hypothetical protein